MMTPKYFAEARLAAYAHVQIALSPRTGGGPRRSVEGKVVRVFAVRGASPKTGERISFPIPYSESDTAPGVLTMPSEEAWARARVVEAYLDADPPGWQLVQGQITLLRRATTEPVNPAGAESFGVAEGPGLWSDASDATAEDDASAAKHPADRRSVLAWWRVQPRGMQMLSAAAALLVVAAVARTIVPAAPSPSGDASADSTQVVAPNDMAVSPESVFSTAELERRRTGVPVPHADPTSTLRRFIADPSSFDSAQDPFDPIDDVTEVKVENDAVRGRVSRFKWRRSDTMVALLDSYDSRESVEAVFAQSRPGRTDLPLIRPDPKLDTYTFGYSVDSVGDGSRYLNFHCARRADLFACSVIPNGVSAILTLVYSAGGEPRGTSEVTDAARAAIGQLASLGI